MEKDPLIALANDGAMQPSTSTETSTPEAAPVTVDPANAPEQSMPSQEEFNQMLDKSLGELPDEEKQLIATYMSPETLTFNSILMKVVDGERGQQVSNIINSYFSKFIDPNRALVPVSKAQLQSSQGQSNTGAVSGAQPAPMQPPVSQPSNQGATSSPAPQMQPMNPPI